MQMISTKKSSRCVACGLPIREGDSIEWYGPCNGARHSYCPGGTWDSSTKKYEGIVPLLVTWEGRSERHWVKFVGGKLTEIGGPVHPVALLHEAWIDWCEKAAAKGVKAPLRVPRAYVEAYFGTFRPCDDAPPMALGEMVEGGCKCASCLLPLAVGDVVEIEYPPYGSSTKGVQYRHLDTCSTEALRQARDRIAATRLAEAVAADAWQVNPHADPA